MKIFVRVFITIVVFISLYYMLNEMRVYQIDSSIDWFYNDFKLEDLITNGDDNIFFIETRDNIDSIPGRTICALESAQRHNPKSKIFFIMDHKTNFNPNNNRELNRIKNLNIVISDFNDIVKDTAIEKTWYNMTKKEGYFLHNISDVLRLVLLYKFGGTYMDTDIITVKPLPDIRNFLAYLDNTNSIS